MRKLLLLPLLLLVACNSGKTANLLTDPGFESGAGPWYSMDTAGWAGPFTVSGDLAHSGSHSAYLKLSPPPEPSLHAVYGIVQDIDTTELPEYVSGFYRVDNWQKGTPFQYLQFVVIAFVTDSSGAKSNVQLRYLLAGAASEPFRIDNAKFIFVGKAEPAEGKWIPFGRNVREDFQQAWGSLPQGVTSVRVFFEARYDSPTAIQPQIGGDVYFDDLYAGPQAKAPAN